MNTISKKCSNRLVADTFTEVKPYHHYQNFDGGWRDGMICGNGHTGVISSGSPYGETLIYQNIEFNMPSRDPRETPLEVGSQLHEARQAVINFDDSWNVHDRKRTYLYCFHPGHQLRIKIAEKEILDYRRETCHETGEIFVEYSDEAGKWIRRTFTSREDDVTITEITKSNQGTKVNATISIDDFASIHKFGKGDEINLQYKKIIGEDCSHLAVVAHYPAYTGSELANGGYAGVSKIIVIGGKKRQISLADNPEEAINVGSVKNPAIDIAEADKVYIITKTDRTYQMGKLVDFGSATQYELVDQLVNSLAEVTAKYLDEKGNFSYDLALAPHVKKHGVLFNSVSFSLGSSLDNDVSNEVLLSEQKQNSKVLDALITRIYNQGRFAQISCAGYSAPRLSGLWTGEWNLGWRGAYTMDANVNLQVSGMNTGNVYDAGIGFIYFVLKQIKDWQENAAAVYGMEDAILIPVNTDGDRAVMVEYDQYYPFQYWNAGASWILLPIYEFWQCYGNQKIPVTDQISDLYQEEFLDLERDILLPLLTMQANFWEQLCTPEYYTNQDGKACYQAGKQELLEGEKYLIIPGYSPENRPKGYNSPITANATMDITAARDGLNMTIALEKAVAREDYEQAVAKWENLISKLPEYKYDATGALREWALNEYEENNQHRHISHLYCAWPAYEVNDDQALMHACQIAIENRNRETEGKDDTASHGWIHRALVAARLKNGEDVYEMLHKVLASEIYFTSLMADHNTNRSKGVYCTDTTLGMVGVINEMLLFSNTGVIEFLPALPSKWTKGSIRGLMARTNVEIIELEWDLDQGNITAQLRSNKTQSIKISCPFARNGLITSRGETHDNHALVTLDAGEEITIKFNF